LRRPVAHDDKAVAEVVSTNLLVIIVVALVTVVGMFMYSLARQPDAPPEIDVNYTRLNDRWSISITRVQEPVRVVDLRLTVRDDRDEFVLFDSNADGVSDALLVRTLDQITVTSGDGAQPAPIVFVDADGDDKVGVGDSLVAYSLYYYPTGPCLDADRGYVYVGTNPHSIPRNSTMQLFASPTTLGSSDIHPGDEIQVTIRLGATPYASVSGFASFGSVMTKTVKVGAAWPIGTYHATFRVRPGEVDEWAHTHTFQVDPSSPITPGEAEQYYAASHPLVEGYVVTLYHRPTTSTVIRFTL